MTRILDDIYQALRRDLRRAQLLPADDALYEGTEKQNAREARRWFDAYPDLTSTPSGGDSPS